MISFAIYSTQFACAYVILQHVTGDAKTQHGFC